MHTSTEVSIDDVLAAMVRIGPFISRTPLERSATLSAITGAEVWVKFENLQFTASYKERGALNRLLLLTAGTPGVVAASAGNFAQGVAYHASRLDLPSVVVMPASTPTTKVKRTEVLGAQVVRDGTTFEASSEAARRIADERGYELLSPFDDAAVIAGQGTVGLEVLEAEPDVDAIIAPVGGGGLLAGVSVAVRSTNSAIELVGVQSERFPGVVNAVTGSDLPVGGSTIAEGIAVARPGTRTTALIGRHVDHLVTVPESAIEESIALLLEYEKTVAEGAGAAALAELLVRPERYRGRKVVVVLSGGNIDLRQLSSVLMRSLVRTGRLISLTVHLDDVPGELGRLTSEVGVLGGNIVEIDHRRFDPASDLRLIDVQLTVEASDQNHARQLVDGLATAGFSTGPLQQSAPSPDPRPNL